MANFKVGDKARVKYIRFGGDCDAWFVGTIVTVVSLCGGIDVDGDHYDCSVACSDGTIANPMLYQLEPIIHDKSTWKAVQAITNWSPIKEEVLS